MARFFAKRIGMMLIALFMIILLTFVIEHSIPGGPFTNDRKVREVIFDIALGRELVGHNFNNEGSDDTHH